MGNILKQPSANCVLPLWLFLCSASDRISAASRLVLKSFDTVLQAAEIQISGTEQKIKKMAFTFMAFIQPELVSSADSPLHLQVALKSWQGQD